MFDGAGKIPCSINGDVRVISVYFHSKCGSSICHHCSDGTKTDDTQLFAHDLTSCKLFFLFLSKFIDVFLVFLFGNPFDTTYDITGSKEHTCKYKLLHTVCIGARCIEYYHAFFCTVLYRNIVDTCTCTCDYLYALRKLHVMHFCTSYKDCITLLQIFAFLIFFIK